LGETFNGRLAFVVFRRLSGGLIRVVTARDMEEKERRLFRRKEVDQNEEKASFRESASSRIPLGQGGSRVFGDALHSGPVGSITYS
jgi:hypothetical protein